MKNFEEVIAILCMMVALLSFVFLLIDIVSLFVWHEQPMRLKIKRGIKYSGLTLLISLSIIGIMIFSN